MTGLVVLCGGNEFEEESDSLNKALLDAVKGKKPRLVVLPIAATQNPRKATKQGVNYFNKIGAWAESMMISDAATANAPEMSAPMETADIIYLTDGNPADAVEGLAKADPSVEQGRNYRRQRSRRDGVVRLLLGQWRVGKRPGCAEEHCRHAPL